MNNVVKKVLQYARTRSAHINNGAIWRIYYREVEVRIGNVIGIAELEIKRKVREKVREKVHATL